MTKRAPAPSVAPSEPRGGSNDSGTGTGPGSKAATPLLRARLEAKLTEEERHAERRLLWTERLTSLWAPVVVFLGAFVVFIFVTQLSRASHAWAPSLIRGLGFVMLLWWAALVGYRLFAREASARRKLRLQADDMLGHLERELVKDGDPTGAVEAEAARLDEARREGDPNRLAQRLDGVAGVADKRFAGWRRRATWNGLKGLVFTLLGVLLLRTVIAEPFRIPSGSMLPTLEIGDHVVVNRFIYGVRIPWANKVFFPIVRRPAVGDVIVFNNPLDESFDFIKRVTAAAGDTVEIRDDVVYLNGEPQPRELLDDDFTVWNTDRGRWYPQSERLYEETLGGVAHAALWSADASGHNDGGPWKVPEGHVFVMGDNRDNSADSRLGFGVRPGVAFVPYGHIKGKAMVVWLALGYDGLFSGMTSGWGLRTDRLFTPIR